MLIPGDEEWIEDVDWVVPVIGRRSREDLLPHPQGLARTSPESVSNGSGMAEVPRLIQRRSPRHSSWRAAYETGGTMKLAFDTKNFVMGDAGALGNKSMCCLPVESLAGHPFRIEGGTL